MWTFNRGISYTAIQAHSSAQQKATLCLTEVTDYGTSIPQLARVTDAELTDLLIENSPKGPPLRATGLLNPANPDQIVHLLSISKMKNDLRACNTTPTEIGFVEVFVRANGTNSERHPPLLRTGHPAPAQKSKGAVRHATATTTLVAISLLILLFAALTRGAALDEQDIRAAAANFLKRPFFARGTEIGAVKLPTAALPCWIVQLKPAGFVLLGTDSSNLPVIGFGTSDGMGSGQELESRLKDIFAAPYPQQWQDPRGPMEWQRLLHPAAVSLSDISPAGQIRVDPLLSTRWTQWTPYNEACPIVTNGIAGYGGRAPTGCVPVAIGQLMRYYDWPHSGIGSSSYSDTNGACQGSYTAIWTNEIAWGLMKDTYDNWHEESPELVGPMADLMARLGVLAETDYEPSGSGADIMVAARGLAQHLNYTMGNLINVSNANFSPTLETEILNRRPVILNLQDEEGHTAVADGLAEDGTVKYVHLNFGWGGENDGWYAGYDDTNSPLFKAIISTLRPATPVAFISSAPNFFELTVTNNTLPDLPLRIMGAGTQDMSYNLSGSEPWIEITPGSGAVRTQAVLHTVHIDASQLSFGTNDAFVTITGDATNLPRRVSMRIYRPDLPTITAQPSGLVSYFPSNGIMSVAAFPGKVYAPYISSDPLRYQWYFNGEPMDGQTNSWCKTIGFGGYQCEVSSLGGGVFSREATMALPPEGSSLKILQSTGQTVMVRVENVQSGKFFIQSSTDLTNWIDLQSYEVSLGTVISIQIHVSTNDPQHYYRVRE